MGLSVVSACSRECSTVCDSHGCSWVGHGAGGRSGAPQQPPQLTPIQFGTSILTVELGLHKLFRNTEREKEAAALCVSGNFQGKQRVFGAPFWKGSRVSLYVP